jgi:hypothetical protein
MATGLTSLNTKQGDIDLVVSGLNIIEGGKDQNISFVYSPQGVPNFVVNGTSVPANPASTPPGQMTLGSAGGTIKITNTAGVFAFVEGSSSTGGSTTITGGSVIFSVPAGANLAYNVPPPIPATGASPTAGQTLGSFNWTIPTGTSASGANLYFDTNFGMVMNAGPVADTLSGVVEVMAFNPLQATYVSVNLGNLPYYVSALPGTLSATSRNVSVSGVIKLTPAQITAMGLADAGVLHIVLTPSCSATLAGTNITAGTTTLTLEFGQMYPVV